MTASKDRLFQDAHFPTDRFQFDDRVASVFDNMVSRSVPFYGDIQHLLVHLAVAVAQPGATIYDLGCSTGTTLAILEPMVSPNVGLVGWDYSDSMLAKAREKLAGTRIELAIQDLNAPFQLTRPSVVILNLVLQFLQPERRLAVLREIRHSLMPGGVVLIVEKVLPNTPALRPLYTELYHDFKRRNGYTNDEISRKAIALQSTLIPLTSSENMASLSEAGFSTVEPFFQWVQFFGVMAQV